MPLRQKSSAIIALKDFLAMVQTQYSHTIKEWMSDAGGEYKSDAFLSVLKAKGIKILQSVPFVPQQNGHAERFNRTIMDKEGALRVESCIPQSWWEFSVEHAMNCYNVTPVSHLKWRTPFEALTGKKPDVSRMRVFGCGAYVFIPPTRRHNKLSPKSELMTYLGEVEGMKGYRFMRNGNILFYSAQALFDEELFPRCKTQPRRLTTRVNEPRAVQPPPTNEDALPGPPGPPALPVPWDNFGNETHRPMRSSQRAPPPAPPPRAPAPIPPTHPAPAQPMVIPGIPLGPRSTVQRGSSMETPPRLPLCPRSPIQKLKAPVVRHLPQTRAGPSKRPQTPPAVALPLPQRSPQHPMYRRLRTLSPLRDVREPSPTPALKRSSCLRRPPTCTGNVYGELRDPTDIEQEISHEAQWEHYTSGASSPEDAPPLQLPEDTPSDSPRAATPLEYADPEQGEEEETSPSGSTELSNGTNSSESVEEILFHWQGLNFLVKEGGVHYLNYLLAKADTPNLELPDVSKVREWSYKDLLRLPKSQQKEWMDACHQELDSLHKCDIYDLVNPPPGRRIIHNRWVFDRKTDGWKQAHLVAKGFSQIEGIDYDDIFSPVVRYELVCLIVALAALQH